MAGGSTNRLPPGFAKGNLRRRHRRQAEALLASFSYLQCCLHVYPGFAGAPGYRLQRPDAGALSQFTQAAVRNYQHDLEGSGRQPLHRDVARPNCVTDGGTDQDLRVGSIFCLLHVGNMPLPTRCAIRRDCSPGKSCRTCVTCGRLEQPRRPVLDASMNERVPMKVAAE